MADDCARPCFILKMIFDFQAFPVCLLDLVPVLIFVRRVLQRYCPKLVACQYILRDSTLCSGGFENIFGAGAGHESLQKFLEN